MPTLSPKTTPYYGGGQVVDPANVKKTSGAPSTKLTDDRLGTLAIDNAAAVGYLLVSKSGGVDTWAKLEAGGAGGSFSTLTSTGATTLATTGASTNTFGNTTGATSVGILAGSGGINLTGAVTSANAVTVTAGNITATNGNLVLGTAGNKIVSTSVASTTTAGANSFGTVTLASGMATISTTAVTASSIIMLTRQSVGASTALGQLTVGTIVANTSFVISAATQATPGTPLAADVSVVGWMIIN